MKRDCEGNGVARVLTEDRAALLAAMYQGDEEDAEIEGIAVVDLRDDTFMGAEKFVSFVVDGRTITVPSVEYCSHLERQLMLKNGEIAELKGQLGAVGHSVSRHDAQQKGRDRESKEVLMLKAQVKAMRTLINRHEREFDDIWRELDKKLNLRD
jgi:hypothetical protein